jgi:hypothetical protein
LDEMLGLSIRPRGEDLAEAEAFAGCANNVFDR